jgi:hypothetical protein
VAESFIIEICHHWNDGKYPGTERGSHTVALGPFDNEAKAKEISARARVKLRSLSGNVYPLQAGACGRWVLGGLPLREGGVDFFDIEQWFGPFEDEATARDWNERNGKLDDAFVVPLLPQLNREIVARLYSPEGWRGKRRG